MAYLLHRKADVADEFVSVVRRQNDKALKLLKTWEVNPEQRLHRARQAFKRIRAALRLVKRALPYVYAVENRFYRDQAHALAYARDAAAMVEALDLLGQGQPGCADQQSLRMLRDSLALRAEADSRDGLAGLAVHVEHVCGQLQAADARLQNMPLTGLRRRTLLRGARRTLSRCQQDYSALDMNPEAAAFHDWRKHIKYAYYQGGLLQEFLPRKVRRMRPSLGTLAELLGRAQDLALIEALLASQPDTLGIDSHLHRLKRVIQLEQRGLQAQALQAGAVLFGSAHGMPPSNTAEILSFEPRRAGRPA